MPKSRKNQPWGHFHLTRRSGRGYGYELWYGKNARTRGPERQDDGTWASTTTKNYLTNEINVHQTKVGSACKGGFERQTRIKLKAGEIVAVRLKVVRPTTKKRRK